MLYIIYLFTGIHPESPTEPIKKEYKNHGEDTLTSEPNGCFSPEPLFKWYLADEEITDTSRIIIEDIDASCPEGQFRKKSMLTIPIPTGGDSAVYMCKVAFIEYPQMVVYIEEFHVKHTCKSWVIMSL